MADSKTVFWIKLAPLCLQLVRELYTAFNGDVDKARKTLLHIKDYGIDYAKKQLEVDERLSRIHHDKA